MNARDFDSKVVRDILSLADDETVIDEVGNMVQQEGILTEAQRLAVREAVYVVLEKALPDALRAHHAECVHGQRLTRMIWLVGGAALGSGLAGAGVTAAILRGVGG